MPEFDLKDSLITSLNAQEPWPDNVKLFQPYEVEQILLPDNASCLAVQAFLKMCNLPFEVEMRWNAEFMSPSGRVPFIKCGAFVVSELEPVAQFAANKGVSLCSQLSSEEKAEMRAYMSLITNVLVNAELWISWIDDETYNAVTKVRNSSVYPWPLGWIQTRTKRNMVAKRLKALHWHDKTLDQVLADVDQCCNSLSQRLGDKDYFFGTPTPLDALIYGHIRALLGASGPRAALMMRPITTALLFHMLRVANLTQMTLTPQEENLVSQVSQLRQSPERPRIVPRNTSSRLSASLRSWDGQRGDNTLGYGFKPFASKQINLSATKEGLTCQPPTRLVRYEESYACVTQILDKVLDNLDLEKDDKEFDFVEFSSSEMGDVKTNLDRIEEDFLVHSETDDTSEATDILENESGSVQDSSIQELDADSNSRLAVTETPVGSEITFVPETEDSEATMKSSSSENIRVKKLMEYIRQKNAEFNIGPQVADVD
ncbi:uncharacterized protein LOC133532237 isoform X3 [Cydia pomonella]|uniref:uncharacterized protein LOC133532237 isoform X3 n=1 Tax=Cydia pomonella TaxID=82600 RepID=UPI002ADE89C8|nr:uncharacterized protein LOC133532237 isoform X3 [Cydia pomonella]